MKRVAIANALLCCALSVIGLAAAPSALALRTAPPAAPLRLVLPLRADLAGLQRFALAVSTPRSVLYHDYASLSQLTRRFGASPRTRSRVLAYLRKVGARDVDIDPTGLFAAATVSTGLAARLFAAPLIERRTGRGERFIAPAVAAAVKVPVALRGLITGVVGLDTRPLLRASTSPARAASQPSSARERSGSPRGCARAVRSGGFTPNQYLTAYGYERLHRAGAAGQGQRVALVEIDGFRSSDIRTFAKCFGLSVPRVRLFGISVPRPLAPGGEATLDLEVLATAAPRLRSIDVYESTSRVADGIEALTAPLRTRQKPAAVSASFGVCEPALYPAIGRAGIAAAEGALQMMAASGITFLAASGDQGSADCTDKHGKPLSALAVSYPASSWWVTGVGGTNLTLSSANRITSELVWNDAAAQPGAAGGGGPSALFSRPDYQNGSSAESTRAVPDVAMLADVAPGYAIYCSARDCVGKGRPHWEQIGGTSAAAPLLAGGIALVDQELAVHHRQKLGLVNPLLYAIGSSAHSAKVFHDVTAIGNDVGSEIGKGPLGCCSAHPGYDEASGLGSVNVAGLARVAIGAQPHLVRLTILLPPQQRALHAHKIRATVSCSAACLTAAYAEVKIGHSRPFEVDSRLVVMGSGAAKRLTLPFSHAQLVRIRAALRQNKPVLAKIRAVLFDPIVASVDFVPGHSIQKQTGAQVLRIG